MRASASIAMQIYTRKMKKPKVLWISPYAPYDKVAHGGGKTHNFYIKYFHQQRCFDITLLSLCMNEEKEKLDLNRYGIKNQISVMDQNALARLIRLVRSGMAYRNVRDKYGGVCLPYERTRMEKMVRWYYDSGNRPDIIILQWTFSLMLIDLLKEYFPDSFVVGIEEDVTFLNIMRKASDVQTSKWERVFWKKRLSVLKERELSALEKCSLIVTNNYKDTKLLVTNGIEESSIFTSAPYIDLYTQVKRTKESKDVIFFGAMSRPENYKSAIWFIENVLPKVDEEIRFIIIGNAPDQSLKKHEGERVVLTGYVEDVSEWFSTCMCMVAPLVGGAGIKIKILEAMSAGVPVLTNSIGIEGIKAADQRDYLYCETPIDYINYINQIACGEYNTKQLSENARKFISDNYNLAEKLDQLISRIQEA